MQGDERTEEYKTSCRQCVFADWHSGIQLGCELGRLEKYIEQGKAEKKEEGHYVIETVCCACRGNEWLKTQPTDKSKVLIIEEEIKAQVAFVIISIDDNPEDLKRLLPRRVSEAANQKGVTPTQIIVVLKNDDASSQDLYDMISEEAGTIPNKLVRIVNPKYDFGRSLDMGVSHVKSHYYCVIQLEHNIPTNMLSSINDLINIDIEPVTMIQPQYGGYSGLVVQTMLHKIFGGNRAQPIYEKLVEAAKIQKREHQIFTWEELWTRRKSPI